MNISHTLIMSGIMILSGLLSTMNVWADRLDDIRISLNDMYMVLLMTGWMLFFMGLFYKNTSSLYIGAALVIFNLWCIRTQFLVSVDQYIQGMIPHHSMAIHMSKKLLEKLEKQPTQIGDLARNIIKTQEAEIQYMKSKLELAR